MTVKELIEQLSKQPNDAIVLVGFSQNNDNFSECYAIKFAWAKKIRSWWNLRTMKVDDTVKTAVIIW